MIYMVRHGMKESPEITCPKCDGGTERMISAPNLNLDNFTSPTEAKYAGMSKTEEIAREKELQKVYETIWLPEPVTDKPWDD
jgi:hypothetical protein